MYQKFECKVKYQKIDQSGKDKMVTETYLCEGVSFCDVEQTINKQLEPYINGEFIVDSIKRVKYSEYHLSGADKYFKARINFTTLDEERGIERKTSTLMLINADDIEEVKPIIDERFDGIASDYELSALQCTNIIDVFVLSEPTKEEE